MLQPDNNNGNDRREETLESAKCIFIERIDL